MKNKYLSGIFLITVCFVDCIFTSNEESLVINFLYMHKPSHVQYKISNLSSFQFFLP
jgi:hypothetical protein